MLRNRLAKNLSKFKWYYFVIPMLSLILGSTIASVVTSGFSQEWIQKPGPILCFVFLGFFSLVIVSLISRKSVDRNDLGFVKPSLTKRSIVVIILVFVVTHAFFILLVNSLGSTVMRSRCFVTSALV